jgi:hypothetical protein
MTAVFADTFYWVALTDPDDALYEPAVHIEALLAGRSIVTTDEVLGEFLTFFSGRLRLLAEPLRPSANWRAIRPSSFFHRAVNPFSLALRFMPPVPTKAIVSPTASRLSLFLYRALTQVWCKANGLWNSRGEQTSAEQFEARATVHLPLERFQPVDVTFYRTIAE